MANRWGNNGNSDSVGSDERHQKPIRVSFQSIQWSETHIVGVVVVVVVYRSGKSIIDLVLLAVLVVISTVNDWGSGWLAVGFNLWTGSTASTSSTHDDDSSSASTEEYTKFIVRYLDCGVGLSKIGDTIACNIGTIGECIAIVSTQSDGWGRRKFEDPPIRKQPSNDWEIFLRSSHGFPQCIVWLGLQCQILCWCRRVLLWWNPHLHPFST